MRKIAVITGTRAEYGLLYWIIKGIHEDPDFELQLIVTGMHLSPEFGMTVNEIENDEFPIADRIEMLLSSDTDSAIATSMGLGMIGFAKTYSRLRPDIILVLGDRFEMLAAVSASVPFRIPVAHIHGGESTEGLIDEPIRHAITKMSHLHFTSTDRYRERVIQMGEQPDNIYCFGAPGLDNVQRLNLMSKKEVLSMLVLPQYKKVGVVTFHPVTLDKNSAKDQITEIFEALEDYENIYWVFTLPNADTEGRIIITEVEEFVSKNNERGKAFTSLGQINYLSLLAHADVMVGNSSSGLIEAPSFELPVVNIGDRQRGRIRAQNIIDVPECNKMAIVEAIDKAISDDLKDSLKGMKNPYGEGGASEKITEKLKTVFLDESFIKKRFYEISQ
jgi:UDP-hydrolysing UDP-N-acetyl-D-glucosamine 2-epimerase